MTSLSLTNPSELKKGFYQQKGQQSKTTLNQLFESIDNDDDNFAHSPILSTITIYSHVSPELQDYDSEDTFIEEFYLSNPLNNQEGGGNESDWSDDDYPQTPKSESEIKIKKKKNILFKFINRVYQIILKIKSLNLDKNKWF